jgi:hypothetical protein
MQLWCRDRGIVIEQSTTEQHQQNGGAEVFNRITMDKLHTTLLSAQIEKKWWPEVLRAANYLRNRSPSVVINKTPYEAWYNQPKKVFSLAPQNATDRIYPTMSRRA